MPPLSAVSERRRKYVIYLSSLFVSTLTSRRKDDAAREARRNERKGRIFSPFWESPVRVPLLPSTSSTSSFSSSSTSPSVSHHSSARHAERALPAAQATGWGPSEDLYTGRALASSRPGLSLNIPRSVPRPARDSSVDVSAIGELEQRKHSLETEIASLAARERQLKEDTARFSAEHAAWSEALSALRQEHDAARASLETEQQSLERAWHDRTEAEDAAARERERLRMARDAAELAQQEYQRKEAEGRRQLEHLQAQIDDAQRITAANARSAGRRLQDDVAKAQVELKTAKSETARAQTELRKILEDTQKARVELQQEQQGVKKAAVEKDVLAESLKKARQHVAAAEVAARDARMQASQEQDHLAAVQRDVSRARVEHLAAEERARAARASAEHEEARARRMKELEDRRAMHAQHASHGPIQDESTAAPKETQTDSRLIFSAPAGEMLPPLLPPMPAPSSRTTTTSASETGSAPAKAVRRPRVRDLFADWDEQTRAESSRVAQVSTESSPTSTLRAVPGSFGLHETAPATPGSGAHTTADAPVIGTASENVAGVLPKHGDHHVLNARSASSSSAPLGRGLVPVPAGQDPPSLSLQRPPTLPSAAEAKCEWDDRRHAPKPPLFAPKKSQSMFDKAKSLVFGASSSQPEAQSSPVEETHAWRRPSATGDLLQLDVQQIPATRAHLPAADMLGNPWATSGDIGGIGAEVESGYDVGNGIASHGTRVRSMAVLPG
jgi:chemotaxis protein histidine kinase CheA